MRVEPVGQALVDHLLHKGLGDRVAQLGLGLALKLGLAQLDGDDGGEALTDVVAREVLVLVLEDALVARVAIDQRGHGGTEAFLVRAAFSGGDRVGVREHRLRVSVGPLQRKLDGDLVLHVLGLDADDLGVHQLGLLHGVEVRNVVDEAALVHIGDAARGGCLLVVVPRDVVGAFVDERDAQALVEERHLLEAGAQRLEVIVGGLEDRRVRPERLHRSGLGRRLALDNVALRLAAVGERLAPHVALPLDLGLHLARQRVHHGDADAVQAARHRVAAAAELSSRVEDRHDHLKRGLALNGVHVDRNAAPVVRGAHAAVFEQSDGDGVAMPGEGLVHGVVHDLVDQVVKTPLPRGADIHAGALAHGLETLENRDVASAVCGLARPYVGVGHRLPFQAPHVPRFGSRPTSVHSTRSERLPWAIQGESGECGHARISEETPGRGRARLWKGSRRDLWGCTRRHTSNPAPYPYVSRGPRPLTRRGPFTQCRSLGPMNLSSLTTSRPNSSLSRWRT